ncbi:MAG: chemotaxis protein CheY [Phycisphaerales bacterium]|nr:chemotaxis protein CheY [Phycisphaerales bacterium]
MKTVLVVDDDPDTAQMIRIEIERRGHAAMIALGGADALQRLTEVVPNAILLDLAMPGLDGMQVLQRLRDNPLYARTRVVIYTGQPTAVDLPNLAAAGVDDVFIKASAKIAQVVDRLLADD